MCNKSSDPTTATTPLMFPFGSMSLVHLVPQDSGLVWGRGGVVAAGVLSNKNNVGGWDKAGAEVAFFSAVQKKKEKKNQINKISPTMLFQ